MKAALAYIILVAAIIAIVALRERPARLAVEPTPAKATVWTNVLTAPPQFCPTPLPICRGERCPKPEGIA